MVYEITDTSNVSPLFDKWEETLIWSCLQGIMGKIYADNLNAPTAAMAMIGDFAFFAGKPNIELVSYKPGWCTQSFMIMVPENELWKNTIIDFYKKKATVISRYAIKKEPYIFDKKKLEKANAKRAKKGLPPQKISQNATMNAKNIQAAREKEEKKRSEKLEKTRQQVKESNEYYNMNANPESLAAKAAMVAKYNEKHNK